MAVQLHCVDRGHQGELWTMELDAEQVVVRNPAGEVAQQFTAQEAVGHFQRV